MIDYQSLDCSLTNEQALAQLPQTSEIIQLYHWYCKAYHHIPATALQLVQHDITTNSINKMLWCHICKNCYHLFDEEPHTCPDERQCARCGIIIRRNSLLCTSCDERVAWYRLGKTFKAWIYEEGERK